MKYHVHKLLCVILSMVLWGLAFEAQSETARPAGVAGRKITIVSTSSTQIDQKDQEIKDQQENSKGIETSETADIEAEEPVKNSWLETIIGTPVPEIAVETREPEIVMETIVTEPETALPEIETITENLEPTDITDEIPDYPATESEEQETLIIETADSPYPCEAVTKTKNVNVREKSSQNSRKITKISKKGTELTVTAEVISNETLWYEVILRDGTKGYIRGDLLQISKTEISSENSDVDSGIFTSRGSEIVFQAEEFKGNQKLAVYSAPSATAWRGAKGKAYVSTNGPVYCVGYTGKWLLVAYDTSDGSNRVGFIDSEQISGRRPDLPELNLGNETVKLVKAATLTDDIQKRARKMRKVKKGESVVILGTYGDLLYVETTVDGKQAYGFLPMSCIQ